MTKVFISGSRKISRLNADIRTRLDRIMEKSLPVIIGDANGADKTVQMYLRDQGYRPVEVFCVGRECRNNVGAWPVRRIAPNGNRRNFDFYASKDRVMAREASFGLMIWDGKSLGTLMNAQRLANQEKKLAIYVSPLRKFIDLKTKHDLDEFVSLYATEVKRRLEDQVEIEKVEEFRQLLARMA